MPPARPRLSPRTRAGAHLRLHLLLLQLDEGQAREVHGVCGQSGAGAGAGGERLCACPRPSCHQGPHSPLSSICSWPDLVEATTLAAISLTVREHSCRRLRWGLCLSAFTWGRVGAGQAQPPARGLPAHGDIPVTAELRLRPDSPWRLPRAGPCWPRSRGSRR